MQFGSVALSLCAAFFGVSVASAQDNALDAGAEGITPVSEAPPPHHDSSATPAPRPEHNNGGHDSHGSSESVGHDHVMQGHAARHHMHDTEIDGN